MLLTPCDPTSPKIHHVSSQRTEKTVGIHLHPLSLLTVPASKLTRPVSPGIWPGLLEQDTASVGLKQLNNILIVKVISDGWRRGIEKGDYAALGVEQCWDQPDSIIPKLNILRIWGTFPGRNWHRWVCNKAPDKATKWQYCAGYVLKAPGGRAYSEDFLHENFLVNWWDQLEASLVIDSLKNQLEKLVHSVNPHFKSK